MHFLCSSVWCAVYKASRVITECRLHHQFNFSDVPLCSPFEVQYFPDESDILKIEAWLKVRQLLSSDFYLLMHSKVSTAKTITQYMAALSSCKKYIRFRIYYRLGNIKS